MTCAVPFAVPLPHGSAQQTHKTACDPSAPGKNRTCDQRFRNSLPLCLNTYLSAEHITEIGLSRHSSNGAECGSGPEIAPTVPPAVLEARDGLRWTTLGFDAAEAMLFGLGGT